MDNEQLLNAIAASLTAVDAPHYHEDERGFQDEFYAQLHHRLRDMVLPEGALLREEYQKKLSQHGLIGGEQLRSSVSEFVAEDFEWHTAVWRSF